MNKTSNSPDLMALGGGREETGLLSEPLYYKGHPGGKVPPQGNEA